MAPALAGARARDARRQGTRRRQGIRRHYIFEYARQHGIEAQIKLKANANPGQRGHQNLAYKRTVMEARLDPEGYAAKANRRSNAEAGNHAFKAFLGDQIYSRLCMCIAYNLAPLVLLSMDQQVEIDFTDGAKVLARTPWTPLDVLHSTMTVQRSKTRRLASGIPGGKSLEL